MAIDPLNGAGTGAVNNQPSTVAARSEAAPAAHHGHGGHHKKAAASDQLDLSETATSLPVGDTVPTGTLTADQLQTVTQKLANGDYNTPASVNRLADALIETPGLLNG
ncbi:MAG TPA: hypothetical protein VGM77_09840 [Gemmatimonadales bacterium]|jgi:hypothetical protein